METPVCLRVNGSFFVPSKFGRFDVNFLAFLDKNGDKSTKKSDHLGVFDFLPIGKISKEQKRNRLLADIRGLSPDLKTGPFQLSKNYHFYPIK